MNILVIETAFIGDAILSLCIAEELSRKRSTLHIMYLVRPESAELIRHSPTVERVLTFDKYGSESGITSIEKKAAELNEFHFDAVICLHTSKRSALLLEKINATRKIGFASSKNLLPHLTDIVEPNGRIQHTENILELARPIVNEIDYSTLPKLVFDENAALDQLLPDRYIVIAPGSVWRTKQWGGNKFAELTKELIGRGKRIVLIGSKDEKNIAEEIVNFVGSNVVNLCGKTSLAESAYVVSKAECVIANDSAPIHIAAACGVRSTAIFGPTVPLFGFAPPKQLGSVVELDELWCRPCSKHGGDTCPVYTHHCMEGISVEMVLNAVIQHQEIT